MTYTKFKTLVSSAENALEACYEAQENHDVNCPEDIYYIAEELLDAGIGAILVQTRFGRLKWFDLSDLSF